MMPHTETYPSGNLDFPPASDIRFIIGHAADRDVDAKMDMEDQGS